MRQQNTSSPRGRGQAKQSAGSAEGDERQASKGCPCGGMAAAFLRFEKIPLHEAVNVMPLAEAQDLLAQLLALQCTRLGSEGSRVCL